MSFPPPPAHALGFDDEDDGIVPPPPPPSGHDDHVPPPPVSTAEDDGYIPPPPGSVSGGGGGVDFLTGSTTPVSRVSTNSFSSSTTRQRTGSVSSTTAPTPSSSRPAASSNAGPPPIPSGYRSNRTSAADVAPPPAFNVIGSFSPLQSPQSSVSPASQLSFSPPLSLAASSALADEDLTTPTSSSSAASSSTATQAAPTAPASLLTAATDLGSAQSFASSLTHNFVGVSNQVEWGSYAAKRAASFMRKLGTAQEEYAKTINKILSHEQSKLEKIGKDQMKISNRIWGSVQELFSQVAKSHLAESSELSLQVVAPLMEFHQTQEERRKEILQEERKISIEMIKAREEVNKSLAQCQKLLDEAKKLQAEAKAEATKEASGEKTGGFFKSLTRAVQKKPAEAIKDAGKAASHYQTAILNANSRQKRYVEADLPKLFNEMQSLETKRLETTRMRLLKFQTIASQYSQERKAIMDDIKKSIECMDSKADISQFINDVLYETGPPTAPRPFSYELNCSPQDIESGRLEGNPNSIFRTSLQQCMEIQSRQIANGGASSQSDVRLDIPRILPTLINRIKDLNGYRELGIFRISVSKEDLDALRKQIDVDGNYHLSNVSNPHICAALLKEWLRLMTDPLIPTEQFYQAAIDSVKGSAGNSYNQAAISKIFDNLPVINQKILKELSLMVKAISEPSNAEISKMNVENLAIVFAPSFLRNPSEDPMKLLENSKFETKFTASLFKVVADIPW